MDARLISKSKDLEFNLNDLRKLVPLIYQLKNSEGKDKIGLISQEVEKIPYLNLLIKQDQNGLKNIDYGAFTVVLLAIIKQMEERISILEHNQKLTIKTKSK